MLNVSDAACEQISSYFKDKPISPIRIFLSNCGCGGPSLSMGLDEPRETDERIMLNGFSFIVDKTLLEQVQPIHIDFMQYGFKIGCSVDFGSGCGSSCSSKGCCGS